MAFSFESALSAQRKAESELRAHFTARFFVYATQNVRLADGNEALPAMRSCMGIASASAVRVGMEMSYLAVNQTLCRLLPLLNDENIPAAGLLHSQICYVFCSLTLAEQLRTAQILEEYYSGHL